MLTIVSLPANFIASTTEVVGDFFGDLSPILWLLAGVAIFLTIVWAIVGVISGHGVWGDKP